MTSTAPQSVTLRFSVSESDDPYDEGLEYWTVEIAGDDDEPIGHCFLTVVQQSCPDPAGQCDAESDELGAIASAVWPGESWDDEGDPAPRPGVGLAGAGDVALISSIHLEPAHRGRGLGLRCAAEILAVLGGCCELVALRARALDAGSLSEPELQRRRGSLARFWGHLGLHPHPDDEVPGLMIGWLDRPDVVRARDELRAGDGVVVTIERP